MVQSFTSGKVYSFKGKKGKTKKGKWKGSIDRYTRDGAYLKLRDIKNKSKHYIIHSSKLK